MIVKSESLFCGLIVDNNWTELRIRLKHCNEIVSKPTLELAWFGNTVTPNDVFVLGTTDQFSIIQSSQWIALWHACDLSILMIGGDEDVICIVEGGQKTVELVNVIIPVNLQVQVATINTAKRVIAIDA